MARRFIARAVLLCSIIVLGASAALAQTAQFTGRVVDSSEGVVPGVTVTATNEENGFLATAVTGADGYYTLSGLGPGKYTIKVELEGFATVQQTGVVLQLGQTARMDFTMQVGAVTDVVDVVGAAPVIQRETTSIGQVIDNTSVTTLPLNGRDYTQLVTLTPGATPNQNSRAADGISLNGARTLQTNYRIDGVDNNNYIMGLDTGSTQALRPSVDSIQEFRVESANFSAQYGNAAGGVVTLAIKSGSNEFKGSAFEFFRDDALDEQEYFSKKSGLAKPPLRYNQFGGTLGGPIVRNRTFFFGSYQGTRNTSSNTLIGTVPTAEMRAGNFGSKAVYDPLTAVGGVRSAFPNNTIPLSRMDPAALKLLALIPQANLSGTVNNYAANAETRDTANQVDVRFDQALGQVSRMFLRYSWQDRDINRAGLFDTDGHGGTAFQNEALLITPTAWSIAGGVTHVLSGTKLNEVRFGFTQNKSGQETPVSEGLFAQYGLGGMPNASALDGLPSIAINNYFRMGSRTFTPNDKRVRIYQFNDTFSWTAGPHGIKFGVEARLKKSMTDSGSSARGAYTFNGQFTSRTAGSGVGDAFADFLLGQTSAASITTFQVSELEDRYIGAFVEDVWRLTPKLTVNAGVRYEIQTPPVDVNDAMANFDNDRSSPTYGTLVTATGGGYESRSFMKVDMNNISPRLGAAYSLDEQTVIRSSYGVFYGGLGYLGNNQTGSANPPFFVSAAINSASTAAASGVLLSTGFPSTILDPARVTNPGVVSLPADSPLSRTQQWNLTVERELPWKSAVSVSYIGSRGSDIRAQSDINQPVPGAGAQNPRRPFPTFGAINEFASWGESRYDALQMKIERRYANGFSFLTSYTFGKSTNNSSDGEDTTGTLTPQDPNNPDAEWALSGADVRHRFVTSFIYDLPFGNFGPAAARAILGGWQLGGVFTAQGGVPMSPTVAPSPANTTGTIRPNVVGDWALSGDERTMDRWYNVAAFAAPAAFTYGNAGRNIIIAPGLVNLDLLVSRTVKLTGKYRLDIRGEFYNVANAVHLGRPELNILSPNAGKITTTQRPPRQVQLGARLSF